MQLLFCTAFLATLLFALLPLVTFAHATGTAKETDAQLAEIGRAAESAAKKWLALVDKKQYKQAWEGSSDIMKNTLDLNAWNQVMSLVREPFGTVNSRELIDERTAKDPKGLPAGEYMVLFYKTTFANRPEAHELITMFLQNGTWSVVTYQSN